MHLSALNYTLVPENFLQSQSRAPFPEDCQRQESHAILVIGTKKAKVAPKTQEVTQGEKKGKYPTGLVHYQNSRLCKPIDR